MLDSLRRTPPVTRALLILITVVYAGQAASQTLVGVDLVEYLGVRFNPDIAAGQWWRLLTPVFLHGSILHLAMNGLALYRLGPQLEVTYGRARYLALFVVAGLAGSLAGFAFSPFASLGASGAIFGLLGAAAVFFFQHRALFGPAGSAIQQNLISVAVINALISFLPGIDGWGHAGGFVGGVLMALAIGPRMVLVRRDSWMRMGGGPLMVESSEDAADDALVELDDGEVLLTGRSPFALVDTRPPGQRTWSAVAAVITLILAVTWAMTAMGIWARPPSSP